MESNNDLKGLACDATKYPELFKYLPWGSFMLEHTKHLINAEVIENRNTFVEQLGITQRVKACNMPEYIRKEFEKCKRVDHMELYLQEDDMYVLVSSLYPRDRIEYDYKEHRWCPHDPIYAKSALTFIKLVPMRKNK